MRPVKGAGKEGERRLAGVLFLAALLLFWTAATGRAGQLIGEAPETAGLLLLFDLAKGPPPAFDRYFRVPEYTRRLQPGESFVVTLPAGRYAVGLYRSATGEPPPPRNGDILCRHLTPSGEPATIIVPSAGAVQLSGIHRCASFYLPDLDTLLAAAQNPAQVAGTKAVNTHYTGIAGTVEDKTGAPVAGILVFARDTGRGCRFVSRPTDPLGRFLVLTDQGGEYQVEAAGGAFIANGPLTVETNAIHTGVLLLPALP